MTKLWTTMVLGAELKASVVMKANHGNVLEVGVKALVVTKAKLGDFLEVLVGLCFGICKLPVRRPQ